MTEKSDIPALKASNISIPFDRVSIKKFNAKEKKIDLGLQGIDVELYQGNTLAIIGPSASGKTTLMLILAGLLQPLSGIVQHFGKNIYKPFWLCHRQYNRAFMIFQDPYSSINPRRKILSWLLKAQHYSSESKKEKIQRAANIIEAVNLSTELFDKYPGQLSGGECQRIAITSGLLSKAKILIFDEPTSMLDPIAKQDLLDLIQEIRKKFHISSLLVTHDMPTAISLCEYGIVISNGKIVDKGSFSELKRSQVKIVQQLLDTNWELLA